jgi:hypothetical protein
MFSATRNIIEKILVKTKVISLAQHARGKLAKNDSRPIIPKDNSKNTQMIDMKVLQKMNERTD